MKSGPSSARVSESLSAARYAARPSRHRCRLVPWLWAGLSIILLQREVIGGEPRTLFPVRPIKIIVYTGPGGLLDTMARKFVDVARKYTNATLYVENRPGAGGIVALDGLVQAPADGYSIMACTKSNLAKLLLAQRADLLAELDWRTILVTDPECVIVARDSQLNSWEAIVADARKGTRPQNWLGPAIGGLDHVTAAKLWQQAHIDAHWIPFGSGGEALAALLGGQGRVYVGNPSDAAGNPALQIIAISSRQRLLAYPAVPVLSDVGLRDVDDQFMWRGFVMKRGTSQQALQWLDRLFENVSRDRDWRQFWEGEGAIVQFQAAQEAARQVDRDVAEFRDYHQRLGLAHEVDAAPTRSWIEAVLAMVVVLALLATITFLAHHYRSTRQVAGELWIALGLQFACICMLGETWEFPAQGELGGTLAPRTWLTLAIACVPCVVRRAPLTADTVHRQIRWPVVGSWMLLIASYFVALELAGFYIASALFLAVTMWWLGYRRTKVIGVVTAGFLLLAYGGLERTLHVALPPGAWWSR